MSMGILRRIVSGSADKITAVPAVALVQQSVATRNDSSSAPAQRATASSILLLLPHISEKASALAALRTYVFRVPVNATKVEIRKAVEKFHGVQVARVNTLRGEGKPVHKGRISGQRKRWKRALVTLRVGDKLEMHVGV